MIACPLTTRSRGLSLHVEIEPTRDNGLDEVSYVQCELIRSVNAARLVHRFGAIEPSASRHVADVVTTLLSPG